MYDLLLGPGTAQPGASHDSVGRLYPMTMTIMHYYYIIRHQSFKFHSLNYCENHCRPARLTTTKAGPRANKTKAGGPSVNPEPKTQSPNVQNQSPAAGRPHHLHVPILVHVHNRPAFKWMAGRSLPQPFGSLGAALGAHSDWQAVALLGRWHIASPGRHPSRCSAGGCP